MLWVASCLCFFGFLRSGEVVCPTEQSYDAESHLGIGDIEVTLKASKKDPF